MRHELPTWFEILRQGSTTPPRSKPRAEATVQGQIRHAMPAVHGWAAAGHETLREIAHENIKQALPANGTPLSLVGKSLRSRFRVLKARRMCSPTRQHTFAQADRKPVYHYRSQWSGCRKP